MLYRVPKIVVGLIIFVRETYDIHFIIVSGDLGAINTYDMINNKDDHSHLSRKIQISAQMS